MRKVIIPAMLGFGVALAYTIGQRMTADAMAVVLGVAVGVAASVPTTVLLMALLRRSQREAGSWRAEPPAAPARLEAPAPYQPQIIVMDPAQWRDAPQLPPPLTADIDGGVRRLRVVGE